MIWIRFFPRFIRKDVAIYSWSPAAGLSCTDCPNPKIVDPQDRTYTVTVWDKDKCKRDQAEIEVKTYNPCDCRKILSMTDEFGNVFKGQQIRKKYRKTRHDYRLLIGKLFLSNQVAGFLSIWLRQRVLINIG